jgi:osmoprotectant transport system permease protein
VFSFLGQVWDWFADGEHWSGNEGIPRLLLQHLQVCAAAMLVAVVVALPIGLILGHHRRGGAVAVNVANIGRAIPSFALLIIGVQIWGIGEPGPPFGWVGSLPTWVCLVALALPPMLANAYVGMSQVDEDVREAAAGMGMRGREVLRKVELPMAMPVVMAGVRTAAVAVVATATLAAITGFGGLGRYVWDGIKQQDDVKLFAGALLVAVLAIVVEVALAGLQRLLVSPGLRRANDSPRS